MPSEFDFLDELHPTYKANRDLYKRLERRGFGKATDDLLSFVGEAPELLALRQDRASYSNFMRAHANGVTGHLRQFGAPEAGSDRFSMGSLGLVRPVDLVRPGADSIGETIYYNVDGVGGDGSEWPAFFDSVDIRAQYTGHRILVVETPGLPDGVTEPSQATVNAGQRGFITEWSPLEETMWDESLGQKLYSILRINTEGRRVVDGKFENPGQSVSSGEDPFPGRGYYLLVRKGCTLLGPRFKGGGYWLFSKDKKILKTKPWGPALGGEIPMWYHYGERSKGTVETPALSRSPTEGLGRIAVSLMDQLSARDWDAFDAARSGKWFSPGTPNVMAAIKEQWDNHSLHIGVPRAFDEETGISTDVTILDDSAGAVAATVFQSIIDAKYREASEESFQNLTSMPDSSGVRAAYGFAEGKAPYLALRAALRQGSEQNAIRFLEMRMGKVPTGFCKYLRKYTLQTAIDDVDRAFQTLRLNQMRSPSMEPEMVIRAIKDRLGSLPLPQGVTEETVRTELRTSSTKAGQAETQQQTLATDFGA